MPGSGSRVLLLRAGRGVGVPYIDINPHRSRSKWWSYIAIGILLVVTTGVVAAALVRG